MGVTRRIFITGTSSGFGFLTARTLASRGHTVIATMRDPAGKNAGAAAELGAVGEAAPGAVHVLALDVTDEGSVRAAVAAALERAGGIDVVVNNAGYGVSGIQEAFTADELQALFDVNVFGVQRVNRAVLPHLRERGEGLLVHVSSVLGRVVMPFNGPYVASKFALEALAETYRYELAPLGIDSIIVEPGAFGTSFLQSLVAPADRARVDAYGEVARTRENLWKGARAWLTGDDAPRPQLVADAVARLVEMPAGQRPLRTVVSPTAAAAAEAINATCSDAQAEMLGKMGLAHMLAPGSRNP